MNSKLPYRMLTREPTLADRATEQLQALILERHLNAGDQLPSERELGELLGVSRTVVRSAVRSLTAKGLLEVRAGAGTFVSRPSGDVISELISIFMSHTEAGDVSHGHLHEMRRVLEIEMASLAAKRRDEADLAEMRRCVNELTKASARSSEWVRADIDFHKAIAKASKNPLFPIVLRSIEDMLLNQRSLTTGLPEALPHAIEYHSRILAEIEKGSVSGTRTVMEEHLHQSEELARKALALQTKKNARASRGSNGRPEKWTT
ncbi:MAG TPA: FadR/GntR family transcriptional regulator [Chloroflexota bacterium]